MTRRDGVVTGVPAAAWLLLVAAGIILAVHVTRDWYQLFGPYLIVRPEVISQALTATGPFLLGAAILVGMARWPAGQRWLIAGVVLLALLGLMRLGSEVAWALWVDDASREPMQAAMIVLGFGAALATALAAISIALGLHASRVAGVSRRWLIATVVVLGGAGLLGAFALVVAWIAWAPDLRSVVTLALPHGMLQAVAIAATVLIAVAAVRAAPRRGMLPEMLIAAGATSSALSLGWSAWFQVLAALVEPDELARYQTLAEPIALALRIIGLIGIIAGFAIGRVFPAPRDG